MWSEWKNHDIESYTVLSPQQPAGRESTAQELVVNWEDFAYSPIHGDIAIEKLVKPKIWKDGSTLTEKYIW